jgi:hypothetical protein
MNRSGGLEGEFVPIALMGQPLPIDQSLNSENTKKLPGNWRLIRNLIRSCSKIMSPYFGIIHCLMFRICM